MSRALTHPAKNRGFNMSPDFGKLRIRNLPKSGDMGWEIPAKASATASEAF